MTIKVLQVDPSPRLVPYAYEQETLAKYGAELIQANCQSEDDVIAAAGDAEIILVSWCRHVTPRVMDALQKARLLGRWGVGYDQFDTVAATERGIAVVNTPAYCGEEVAEHTIGLLFAAARGITWAHDHLRAGEYRTPPYQINRLSGRTLGLIGVGRIGAKVAKRAQGLGLNVIAYDRYRPAADLIALGIEPRSFEEVLSTADYVSLHTPLNSETRKLIDADALRLMKPTAMLINTSRGPVIDQDALIVALRSGAIAAAAIDVYEEEPLAPDHPIRTVENITLTPHIAAWSEDSIELLHKEMTQNVVDWITTGWSNNVVNPEVRDRLRT